MVVGRGAERRQRDDRQAGLEAFEVTGTGTAQQIADEECVPGVFTENARRQAMDGIGAGEKILDVEFFQFGEGEEIVEQAVELLFGHRLVVVPPDGGFGVGIADDELVVDAAAGVLTGLHDERAGGSEAAFVAADRGFNEFWGRIVDGQLAAGVQREDFSRHRKSGSHL